jgi:Arc/MetJ-type ribon-helix-helix transcriptional regulator
MSSLRNVIGLVMGLSMLASPALGYGVAINSSTGANISGSFRQFETGILDKIAENIKDAKVEPDSRIETVIDQSGKVVDVAFLTPPPAETVSTDIVQKIKALNFDPIPGIEEGTLSLSFFFSELSNPPYRMNSLRISSSGSIRSGDIDTSGKPPSGGRRVENRIQGNRISGPLQLGPPNVASQAPVRRSGLTLEEITDFVKLDYMIVGAAARKRYDQAAEIHKHVLELVQAGRVQNKAEAIRAALRWPSSALDAGQVPAAQKAFDEAVSVISGFGDDAATEKTISSLTILATKFVSRDALGTADSAIRKAIDLDAIRLKNGITSPRVSLAYPLKHLVSAYEKKKDFESAIALERYRLDKCRHAEPDNTAAIVVCQMDLAGVLLDAAIADAASKAKFLAESNQIFDKALADVKAAFGADSQEFKETVSRRIYELTQAGQAEAVSRLQKMQ